MRSSDDHAESAQLQVILILQKKVIKPTLLLGTLKIIFADSESFCDSFSDVNEIENTSDNIFALKNEITKYNVKTK